MINIADLPYKETYEISLIYSTVHWDCNDNDRRILDHLSNWITVTRQELEILDRAKWSKGFEIFIKIPHDEMILSIRETVREIIAAQLQEEQKREQERIRREADSKDKKLRRKQRQLEKLQRELGVVSHGNS